MQDITASTLRKALTINLDKSKYGTFAEIGAGQEVARYFFQAGRASNTIAKTMSAYDKVFSDSIYGKGSRFVSQDRLEKMLSHEFQLIENRLGKTRGSESSFFVFSNTVATSSHEKDSSCHGWIGVMFQLRPGGPVNQVHIHVRMLDRLRLQQVEALGVIGVNLIFACFYLTDVAPDFIASLIENISDDRIDIDYIHFEGDDLDHIDNRLVALELVQRDMTKAVMYSPKDGVIPAADHLYKKPLIVQRGTFRPITLVNEKIMEAGIDQIKKDHPDCEPLSLMEMTLSHLIDGGQIDQKDILDRIDTLCSLGHHVLISNYPLYYQLKAYLRRYTDSLIVLLAGANILENLFKDEHYQNLHGGTLEAFGTLFDNQTELLIFPFKTDELCLTTQSFFPPEELTYLYKHLLSQKKIKDLLGCDDLDTDLHSSDVRKMLASGDPNWRKFVPEKVGKMIEDRLLFNIKK